MTGLRNLRLRVERRGHPPSLVPLPGTGVADAEGLRIEVVATHDRDGDLVVDWSVANDGPAACDLQAVALVWDAAAAPRPRMLANGWQSWSRSRVMVLGEDEDPSRHPDAPELARWLFLGDARVAPPATLRSSAVGVVDLGGGARWSVGFDAAAAHDGVVWLARDDAPGTVTVAAEAALGGATLAPGAVRRLHRVRVARGDGAADLLGAWAERAGPAAGARARGPFTTGWCSWYRYFAGVDEAAFLGDLATVADWPLDVFQLDDGWQPAIGDWLCTNDRFPSGLAALAARVRAAGRRAGLWLAPFLAAPDSRLAREHPDWLARMPATDAPLPGGFNPAWGGLVHALDTTRPDVEAHLESLAAQLVALGFDYLKLDFTYAPALPGRFADPTRTPAERVRAGFAAVRRGAGDAAFLLGCGAPLAATVGLVDAMRIGPDVAPRWTTDGPVPGFDEESAATVNAWRSTLVRSPFHRRLWQNDPDCVMLRRHDTGLTPAQARAWAHAVGVSGGLVVVSDTLGRLDADARRTLDEVIALGRAADAGALAGRVPAADDVLETRLPRRLASAAGSVELAPDAREATLVRAG